MLLAHTQKHLQHSRPGATAVLRLPRCMQSIRFVCGLAASLSFAALSTGCSTAPLNPKAAAYARTGDFGKAAAIVQEQVSQDRSDPNYMLTRLRLLNMGLAEGQPAMVDEAANQLFALLRTQGVNEEKAVATVVFSEGVRIWKGEPFEQAMAYAAVASQKAMMGEWDNARAASNASLFLLKDFSQAMGGKDGTPQDLAAAAARKDRGGDTSKSEQFLDNGYVVGRTDFALGYLLNAASNIALARDAEASDNLTAAEQVRPAVAPIVQRMRQPFNTLMLVEWGEGPEKISFGEDNTLTRFEARTRSDDRQLQFVLRDANGTTLEQGRVPFATDINAMARSHRWNDLQTVRNIKSALGTALFAGGLIVASEAKDNEAKIAGAIAAGLGLLMKAGSSADIRYAEFLPQRVYVLPLTITMEGSSLELSLEGDSASTTTLWALRSPGAGAQTRAAVPMQLRVIKLASSPGRWQNQNPVLGGDLFAQRIPGDDLPYVFGGTSIHLPSQVVMDRYHASGNLLQLQVTDLENLYREEGIALRVEDMQGRFSPHIVDGGKSLVPPLEGTTGALRVFGRTPPKYEPRSDALKQAIAAEQSRSQ
jgi:hypothetical protein